MSNLISTIIGGVIVAVIVAIMGINTNKVVISHGEKKKKTGRWIIFFSWCAIFGGLAWAGNSASQHGGIDLNTPQTLYGLTLAGYGLLSLFVGNIVKFFQD